MSKVLSLRIHFEQLTACLTGVLTVWLLVGGCAAYAMGSYTDNTLSAIGGVLGDGDSVILEPEKWIGKRLPLLPYIDIDEQVARGRCAIVFYHATCPECKHWIDSYYRCPTWIEGDAHAGRVAFVQMPPYHGAIADYRSCDLSNELRGRLSNKARWFLACPIAIELADGVVSRVIRTESDFVDFVLCSGNEISSVWRYCGQD
jgi:hypothetical protein